MIALTWLDLLLAENEASQLKSEITRLRTQITTCSSSGSAGTRVTAHHAWRMHTTLLSEILILAGHQSQVKRKMKQLLETYDSDTFLSKFHH